MKKFINLFLIVFLAITAVSCGNPYSKVLKAQIEAGQKHCPMSLGMVGKISKMSYDEDNRIVNFTITLNKSVSDIKDLQEDPESARQTLILALQKGDMKKLVEMMADADAGLKVTYKNRGSKDEFVIDLSADDIKHIKDNPLSEEETNKLLLKTQLQKERNKLPAKIAQGLKVVAIDDNGSVLVYTCDVDEDLYDIDEMGADKEGLKDNMRKMMKDKAMRKQAEILSSLNKGFEYKYVGNKSGKSVPVTFTAAELKEITGK